MKKWNFFGKSLELEPSENQKKNKKMMSSGAMIVVWTLECHFCRTT